MWDAKSHVAAKHLAMSCCKPGGRMSKTGSPNIYLQPASKVTVTRETSTPSSFISAVSDLCVVALGTSLAFRFHIHIWIHR